MSIGIQVANHYYSIGTGSFFHSFFSTIAVNVENKQWGSRFPTIMKKLYAGTLSPNQISPATMELEIIKSELTNLSTDYVVWEAEDLSKRPPWGTFINPEIRHLADYFVTDEGENLIEVLNSAFEKADIEQTILFIN